MAAVRRPGGILVVRAVRGRDRLGDRGARVAGGVGHVDAVAPAGAAAEGDPAVGAPLGRDVLADRRGPDEAARRARGEVHHVAARVAALVARVDERAAVRRPGGRGFVRLAPRESVDGAARGGVHKVEVHRAGAREDDRDARAVGRERRALVHAGGRGDGLADVRREVDAVGDRPARVPRRVVEGVGARLPVRGEAELPLAGDEVQARAVGVALVDVGRAAAAPDEEDPGGRHRLLAGDAPHDLVRHRVRLVAQRRGGDAALPRLRTRAQVPERGDGGVHAVGRSADRAGEDHGCLGAVGRDEPAGDRQVVAERREELARGGRGVRRERGEGDGALAGGLRRAGDRDVRALRGRVERDGGRAERERGEERKVDAGHGGGRASKGGSGCFARHHTTTPRPRATQKKPPSRRGHPVSGPRVAPALLACRARAFRV